MSIADNPLTGPMRKSMGNFTMYSYNGMNIVRSKPFKVKDAKTEKQLNMRTRMTLMAEMYHAFCSIIGLGFPENSYGKSPQNMFVSANFSSAFIMKDQVPVISYPLMLVSKGSLPIVKVTEAAVDDAGITVQYDAGLSLQDITPLDELIACARLITGELLITRQIRGYEALGTITIKYPDLQAEEVACCYVFTRSSDGKKASDSGYVEVNS